MRRFAGVGMQRCGSKLMAAALLAVVSGCSGRSADFPDLAPVSGTITMDGEPLANAGVVFTSPKGIASFGRTDTEGKYSLAYRGSTAGAGLGENRVEIVTNSEDSANPDWQEPIPAIYNTASTLTASVNNQPDGNTFDFALESKPKRLKK